jgi:hypothetical protein
MGVNIKSDLDLDPTHDSIRSLNGDLFCNSIALEFTCLYKACVLSYMDAVVLGKDVVDLKYLNIFFFVKAWEYQGWLRLHQCMTTTAHRDGTFEYGKKWVIKHCDHRFDPASYLDRVPTQCEYELLGEMDVVQAIQIVNQMSGFKNFSESFDYTMSAVYNYTKK